MMPTTVQQMLAEANASVPKLLPSKASDKIKAENTLILDVRDPSEVEKIGTIKGAVNVSRGMLEFRADPESPYHNPAFQTTRRFWSTAPQVVGRPWPGKRFGRWATGPSSTWAASRNWPRPGWCERDRSVAQAQLTAYALRSAAGEVVDTPAVRIVLQAIHHACRFVRVAQAHRHGRAVTRDLAGANRQTGDVRVLTIGKRVRVEDVLAFRRFGEVLEPCFR